MNSKLLSFQPLSQSEGLWLCLHALGVIPGFGLGLAAPTISFQILSCVTRVLGTAAHGKLYLGNKQPVADTADTVYSVGTALLSTVTPHLQQGLYPHRNPSQALQTHRSFPENPQDEQQMSSRSWMSQCLTPFAVRQLSHPESVVPAAPGELEAPVVLTGNLCSSGQIHHSEGSDTPFSHLMDHLESSQLPITSQEQKQSPHTDTLAHGFSLWNTSSGETGKTHGGLASCPTSLAKLLSKAVVRWWGPAVPALWDHETTTLPAAVQEKKKAEKQMLDQNPPLISTWWLCQNSGEKANLIHLELMQANRFLQSLTVKP